MGINILTEGLSPSPATNELQGGQVAYIAAAIMFVRSGGGTHMWDLQLKDFFNVLYVCILRT